MSTIRAAGPSSDRGPSTFATVRTGGAPSIPPKPSHLHSVSVRASSSTNRPGVPSTFYRGVPVQIARPGIVQQRLSQFGGGTISSASHNHVSSSATGSGGSGRKRVDTGMLWSSSEDERELEVDEARWEQERLIVRLERERRRAEAEAAVRSRHQPRPTEEACAPESSNHSSPESRPFPTYARHFSTLVPSASPVLRRAHHSRDRSRRRDGSTIKAPEKGRRGDQEGGGGSTKSTLKVVKPRTRKISARAAVEDLFGGSLLAPPPEATAVGPSAPDRPELHDPTDDARSTSPYDVVKADDSDLPTVIVSESLTTDLDADADKNIPPPIAPAHPIPSNTSPASHRLSILTFLTSPLPAIALFSFSPSASLEGYEQATKEVGFQEGDKLAIGVEDVGGGWSLGWVEKKEAEGDREVGLVPRGWYEFVEDIVPAENGDQEPALPEAPDVNVNEEPPANTAPVTGKPDPETPPLATPAGENSTMVSPSADEAIPTTPSPEPQGPAVSVRASDAFWRASLGDEAATKLLAQTTGSPSSPKYKAETPPPKMQGHRKKAAKEVKEKPRERKRSRQTSGLGAWLIGGRTDAAAESGARSYIFDGSPTESRRRSQTIEPTDAAPKKPQEDDERGGEGDDEADEDQERYEVDPGPSWRTKVPLFAVQVHSPATRIDDRKREHTVFSVTSTAWRDAEGGTEQMTRMTVERRYSQFEKLAQVLAGRYPGLVLPALPEKQHIGRFGAVFLETRRRGLERYLTRLVRHPLLRHSPPLVAFLSLSDHDGSSYDELVRYWIAAGPPPPGEFFAKVWHPEWNVDRDDAVKEVDRWGRFVQAVEGGGGVADVDHAVARVRSTMQDLSDRMQDLSKAILRLSAGMNLPPATPRPRDGGFEEDDEDGDYDPPDALGALRKRARAECVQTLDGAWCWREGCRDCLAMTKALQETGATVALVASLYHGCSEEAFAPLQELLKESSSPHRQHKHLLDLHKATLTERDPDEAPEVEARRETVLNVTMSEMERYHSERNEDFCDIAERLLDEQMDLHQRAYDFLRTCRFNFGDTKYGELAESGPRAPNSEELALLDNRLSPHSGHSSSFAGWSEGSPASSTTYAGSVASTLWNRPVKSVTSSVFGLRDLFA